MCFPLVSPSLPPSSIVVFIGISSPSLCLAGFRLSFCEYEVKPTALYFSPSFAFSLASLFVRSLLALFYSSLRWPRISALRVKQSRASKRVLFLLLSSTYLVVYSHISHFSAIFSHFFSSLTFHCAILSLYSLQLQSSVFFEKYYQRKRR